MSEPVRFTIGSEVRCADGAAGELRRVVVDPVARAVTHLAVEPKHQRGTGRLVPVELVEAGVAGEDGIRLSCTRGEFEALEAADETRLLPMPSGMLGYGGMDMLALPYYGLGMPGLATGGTVGYGTYPTVTDRVPVGEVEVRRGEPVHATDGAIGRVQGLVIDPSDHSVTHVLLDEGHLWGKKRVAIPISAVADVADGVHLTLSKDDVRDLPQIDLADPQ